MSMVDDEGMLSEERVDVKAEAVVRCLPAWTRRREEGGRVVRRERSWRSVVIVVEEGIDKGITSETD